MEVPLGFIALVGLGVTVFIFAPGYMSYDTTYQLQQALGRVPLSDWHPPVMSLLWRGLIDLTDGVSSMAILQEAVFWASLWRISATVWRTAGHKGWAIGVYGLAALPFVLSFVGVVWKDVQLAFALLAALAIALDLRASRQRSALLRVALLFAGLLLLAYATLVRKNAIFAVLPVLVLLGWSVWERGTVRRWVALAGAGIVVTWLPATLITQLAHPRPTNQVTQVMLDDLLHVMSPTELRKADAPAALQHKLAAAAQTCAAKEVLMNTYWDCYGRGSQGNFTSVAYPGEIMRVWVSEIPKHLSEYLQYRTHLFARFLFWDRDFFQPGIQRNDLGVTVDRPLLQGAMQDYVLGWQRNLPWLFAGWFWLVLNVLLLARPGRGPNRVPVRLLGLSGSLYVLGYLPVVPQTDFRYLYWSVISGSVGSFLVLASRSHLGPMLERPAFQEVQPKPTE